MGAHAEEAATASENTPLVVVTKRNEVVLVRDGPPHALLGMGCVAASAFCFSIMSTVAKYESAYLSPLETVFWRSLATGLINSVCLAYTGHRTYIHPDDRRMLLFRSMAGFGSICGVFYAISHLVLADASAIIFTSPIITFFMGACLLGEPIDPIGLVCAFCAFSGLICVARPGFVFGYDTAEAAQGSWLGVTAGLASAVFQGFVYTSVRKLRHIHFLVILHYFMIFSGVVSLSYVLLVEQRLTIPSTLSLWLAVIANGVFSFLGQCFLTKGLQLEKAGLASVMRYLDVVFVFIWDASLIGETINTWSIVGAAIICSSASVIAVRKSKNARQD